MKNREKFAKEILDIVCNGSNVALDRSTGSLQMCEDFLCNKCYFNPANYPKGTASCIKSFAHWANSEYRGKKEFSEADKAFVKAMDKLSWFVRNKKGDVWGFQNKPFKKDDVWSAHPSGKDLMGAEKVYRYFTSATFEPLSWDDEEPVHRSKILGE